MTSFHFANTFYTLYCECILYYRSKHKHKKSCFVNGRILESFYKKGKKLRKKMKKWQIENSENSKISEKLFRVFLFPNFRFCATAKTENSDLIILEKNFRVFRVFDLAFQAICFRLFCSKHSITFENTYLLGCWFQCVQCVNIFYIKFRFCEAFSNEFLD